MRSVLVYTAARLLLFAATFGVVYLLGAREFLALALAFLISGMVSYVVLSAQRDAMSGVVAQGLAKMRGMGDRLEEGSAKEDAAKAETAKDETVRGDATVQEDATASSAAKGDAGA